MPTDPTVPSCTGHQYPGVTCDGCRPRLLETEARVVEAAMAYIAALSHEHGELTAIVRRHIPMRKLALLTTAVRAMEGNEDHDH